MESSPKQQFIMQSALPTPRIGGILDPLSTHVGDHDAIFPVI